LTIRHKGRKVEHHARAGAAKPACNIDENGRERRNTSATTTRAYFAVSERRHAKKLPQAKTESPTSEVVGHIPDTPMSTGRENDEKRRNPDP